MWLPFRRKAVITTLPDSQPAAASETYAVAAPAEVERPVVATTVVSPPLWPVGKVESRWTRALCHLIALAVTAAYFLFLYAYYAPAPGRPGIDENAYLVAGKMLAYHGSPALTLTHPMQYVDAMWIRTAPVGDTYYPKYPAGLPLLYAALFWIFGAIKAKTYAFLVSPVAAALSCYMIFLLGRRVSNSWFGLLALVILALGPTTLQLAELPNSHAPCLFFVLAGMTLLVCYAQCGKLPAGLLAGFLLGYAFTIRYSQGLMGLPVLAACLFHVRWRNPGRKLIRPLLPLAAWAVPVAALAIFNFATMRHFSGYDATHESSGFTLKEFLGKWDFSVVQLHLFGLFFLFPLGIAGLLLMWRQWPRTAVLFALWFLPGAVLYTSYYWGQRAPGVAFLRFFLDLYAPLIVAGLWLLYAAMQFTAAWTPPGRRRVFGTGAAMLFFAAVPAVHGVWVSLPEMARQKAGNLNLAYSGEQLLSHIPEAKTRSDRPPVIFADEGMFPQLLMYAQFIGDAEWYEADAFTIKYGGGFSFLAKRKADKEQDSPVLIQTERREYMENYLKGKSALDLIREQNQIMTRALDEGRNVYAVLNSGQRKLFEERFLTPGFQAAEIAAWSEPTPLPKDPPASPLSPGGFRMNLVIPWTPQSWHLLKITHTPLPASRPATQPG